MLDHPVVQSAMCRLHLADPVDELPSVTNTPLKIVGGLVCISAIIQTVIFLT